MSTLYIFADQVFYRSYVMRHIRLRSFAWTPALVKIVFFLKKIAPQLNFLPVYHLSWTNGSIISAALVKQVIMKCVAILLY